MNRTISGNSSPAVLAETGSDIMPIGMDRTIGVNSSPAVLAETGSDVTPIGIDRTIGVNSSPAMLAETYPYITPIGMDRTISGLMIGHLPDAPRRQDGHTAKLSRIKVLSGWDI